MFAHRAAVEAALSCGRRAYEEGAEQLRRGNKHAARARSPSARCAPLTAAAPLAKGAVRRTGLAAPMTTAPGLVAPPGQADKAREKRREDGPSRRCRPGLSDPARVKGCRS